MLLEFSRKDNHYRLLKYLAHVLSAAMLDVFIIDLGTQFTCLTGTKVQILTQKLEAGTHAGGSSAALSRFSSTLVPRI
jgi:hypothetical protein